MEEVLFCFYVRNAIAVHSLARQGIEFEAFEPGHVESPSVLRGDGIDAHSKQAMREGLEQFNDFVAYADRVSQVLGIRDARQARFLFVRTEAGEIVFLVGQEAFQILLALFRKCRVFQKFQKAGFADDVIDIAFISCGAQGIERKLVSAESFLIEKNARLEIERAIKIFIYVLWIGRHIDAQLFDQALGNRAVRRWALDGIRTAESEYHAIARTEFIALGVSAKIVVIVEDQNPRVVARGLLEKMRRRETTDASTDDHQVVHFASLFGFGG